jgi:fido (protein-threonine AMPylation protein)
MNNFICSVSFDSRNGEDEDDYEPVEEPCKASSKLITPKELNNIQNQLTALDQTTIVQRIEITTCE